MTPPSDLTPLRTAMCMLDAYLTGARPSLIFSQSHLKPATPAQWFEEMGVWYLCDGGYSRIQCDWDRVRLAPTSTSTARVLARWDDARPLVDAVEHLLLAHLADADPQAHARALAERTTPSAA